MEKKSRYSLRITISGLLIVLLVLALGGTVAISLLVRARSLEATSRTILGEVSRGMAERLRSRVDPAEDILTECVRAAERGYLPTDDVAELATRLAERVRHDPRFEWLGFINPQGQGAGAVRREGDVVLLIYSEGTGDDMVMVQENLYGDDRREEVSRQPGGLTPFQQAAWFDVGAAADGPAWTERYLRPYDQTYGRACAAPLQKDDQLVGVFGIGYGLAFVGDYIRDFRVAETGRLFGVHLKSGQISVAPTPEVREQLGPAVEEALRRLPDGLSGLEVGKPFFVSVPHAGTTYVVALEKQELRGALAWVNAAIVPEKELVGFLDRYATVALVGIGILLLCAIALAQLLARRVSRPLRLIADDLERVAAFELSSAEAPRTKITEVAVVGGAVDRMKAGLRSFSRYVPTDLVRDLLREGQEARLDGRTRPLTLFFSDVKGFTSVSEGMSPQALVDALGDYLDVVVKGVSAEQGTIDKFMGDGVLAFFNAPRKDPRHAAHACRAALGVQAALAEARSRWAEAGQPSFETRIGLHTGEVVVGNIGTPDRFSYTVLGDGVNLAARLESVNKAYGTWILASDQTRAEAGDGFEWRHVDRTAVAGKSEGVDIFELLGREGTVADDVLVARDQYQAALGAYFDRRFEEAAEAFFAVHETLPDDGASRVLGERARLYATAPPPDDWNGVYVQTKK